MSLSVYICYRPDNTDWEGALLIAAHDKAEATRLYLEFEGTDTPPHTITVLTFVGAEGDPRILYNDKAR